MLEPNDSEINIDNTEDACKSDYFSDEGELKNETPGTENGSSGKRKPIDIGLEEAKKIKVSVDEISTTDKITNLKTAIPPDDFKRASSVTSDNSDEFVDASDVLEPVSTVDVKPSTSDEVDASAVKTPLRSDASKSMFESVSPKVKDKKFNLRLPTFADDPLDHFNSSAIRRGFFKEVEPSKAIDSNLDLNLSDKNELKTENKTIRKVKLNRSKFFSNDKPKFSDDSSSDSNSKFNNSASPKKIDLAPSNENNVVQSVKVENKITQPLVEEKITVANEPPAATPCVVELPKTDIESISNVEPENIHSIDNENIPAELPSSANIEEKIQDDLSLDQLDPRIEQESLEIPRIDNTISEPIDSNLDQTETEELTFELDDLMEESIIEPVSKNDEVMNELLITDDEPLPQEQIETEYESMVPNVQSTSIETECESVVPEPASTSIEPNCESVMPEPESTSIEPEFDSVVQEPESTSLEIEPQITENNEPEPLPIESEHLPIQLELDEPLSSPQPTQSNEPSSPRQLNEPSKVELMEDEAPEQRKDQVEESKDDIPPFKDVPSEKEFNEAEQIFVSESGTHQEPILDLNPVSEIVNQDCIPSDELVDIKEDTRVDREPVQELAISESIPETDNIETEPRSQGTDLDITNEFEDITDDKTETYVSNEESEGEIEEEEEEEIHEEELYLEDRVLMTHVTKPKDPSPSPQSVPPSSTEKETKDIAEIISDQGEAIDEPVQQLENIENISIEQPLQRSPAVEQIEDISVEQEDRSSSENIEDISMEQTIQRTPSLADIADIPVEQAVQRSLSLENIADVPVEQANERPPSLEDIADISVQKSIQRTPSLEDIENIPMDIDEESKSVVAEPTPKGLSKLEQALIGKSGIKKLEIQVPLVDCPIPYEIANERASSFSVDNEETKEKIKLHLSLQGDKVSIKKSPNTLVTSTGEVKTKRQYKKRNKEEKDLKPDKTYKLRTRSSKKDSAAQENGQAKPNVSSGVDKIIDLVVDSARTDDPIYSAEPILIDSDDSNKSNSSKVQPLKLKITKNTNVTIECPTTDRDFSEDTRKKDSIPNLMEQAATAWSGPDLQRVERLLKESNITITPVLPKESIIPQSILKPMLSATKEKPSMAPKFSTPSVTSSSSFFPSSTSCITPISRDKYEDSSSSYTSPQSLEHQNGETVDHRRFKDVYETSPSSSDKQIDIKSEIRKMLASSDKRKIEPRDSTDMESDSSDSKPKLKSVPDLVPINLPTPEMLQSLATSLGANTTAEGDAPADKSKPGIDPAFLPLLQTFPKKRGRPTKAMVAAREALKQSQEVALENLKQLATQKASEGQPIPIPILDITDPEELFKPKRGRKSRNNERMDKSSDAEQSASETTIDPEKEAEEIKRLEEERIRKEEEKERRNEIRRQKARERNDLVKAKRLRQKMKAEERQKRMQEKRRKLQEEKKKLEEEIKNLPTSMPGFDDETRMSAENSQALTMSFSTGLGDEDSSNATNELSQRVKKSRMEVTDIDSRDLTVDQIAEYQWPIQGGDLYMIQEQVSNYLGVKSFKRKYPDIKRRPVDSEEKAYLVDSGLVSETLCDLGLTAVVSAEVLDIMCADFPEKYEELRKYMREKQMKELSFKQKAWANGLGYKLLMADGTKQDLKKRAMESASNWNLALNKSRSDDRRCAIDLQTFIVHYPKTRTRKMTIPTPKMGSYPVSILPGQFCDFYKNYTSTELRYMPINTVMYGPLKPHANGPTDGNQSDSDDSSSSDESSTTSEGTQATEDTIEDTDKDMSVDESSLLDKSHDLALLKEQMTMELSENTRELIMDETAKILCKVCLGNITRNKENVPEVLIYCSQCSSTSHPSCLDLSLDMVPHIKKYAWQCPDCKICARCKENADEDKMLFCDICDRGYHIYCVGLKKVPSGRWQCQECTTVENNSCVNNSTPVREVFKEPGLIDLQDG